jgi:hyperosmotically inducible protein
MFRTFAQLTTAVALAMLTAAPAAAQKPAGRDMRIAYETLSSVNGYSYFTVFDDVSVHVADGVVTLTGKVTMPHKRDDIGKRVARLDGVTRVANEITVLPLSRFDDELRQQIARSIYGHANFFNYAAMTNPPIHIIVEHGAVTLTGVVASETDRSLARMLALQFPARTVNMQLKTDAEVRAAELGDGRHDDTD